MTHIYAFVDAIMDFDGFEKYGYYNKVQGVPCVWAIGPKQDIDVEGFFWSTLYSGKRYVFQFVPYEDEDRKTQPFFSLFLEKMGKEEFDKLDEIQCDGGHKVYLYQTDEMLPGFDVDSDMWCNMEPDDLLGDLSYIDTHSVQK